MLFLEVLNMTTLNLKQTIPKPRSLIRFLFLTTGQIIALLASVYSQQMFYNLVTKKCTETAEKKINHRRSSIAQTPRSNHISKSVHSGFRSMTKKYYS